MRPELRLLPSLNSAVSIVQGIEHYLARLTARGACLNTIKAYRSDLVQFAAFVADIHLVTLVSLLSARHVSRWLDELTARGVIARSQARKLSVLRAFMKYARREGWIGFDPTADEQVRFRTKRVLAPEMDALHAMVDTIGRTRRLDRRDRAMLRLALDTGLRISEMASIDAPGTGTQTSIDLKRRLAHVVSKGGDIETVPFNDRTCAMLEDWLAIRADMANPGQLALFVSQQGKRCCRMTLHERLKKHATAAGLPDMHFHMLRHRRGAQVFESCGIKVAQQFLRHASIETTGHYGRHADGVAFALIRDKADIDAGRSAA
jgi:integrase/recombinase XerC